MGESVTGVSGATSASASTVPLWRRHAALVFDLDGVVYAGSRPIPHAVEVLRELEAQSAPVWFATNNASRTAVDVGRHLGDLGISTNPSRIVTSSDACADYISRHISTPLKVRLVGAAGIRPALDALGATVYIGSEEAEAACDVVVQGHSRETDWYDLAAGFRSIESGATWIATNMDLTIPLEYGLAPGNGALVAGMSAALGRNPDVVIGKPFTPMFDYLVTRTGVAEPLIIGDRRDTDIAWANRHGCPSLLVDTGVDRIHESDVPQELLSTYVADDLRGLLREPVAAA